jgi:hypothetical protein
MEFLKTPKQLIKLIDYSNYLGIHHLVQLTAAGIASLVKDKPVSELGDLLGDCSSASSSASSLASSSTSSSSKHYDEEKKEF